MMISSADILTDIFHERLWARTTQLSHSWIPYPQKLSEKISIYYIKMLSFKMICHTGIDEYDSLDVEGEGKNKASFWLKPLGIVI